MPWMSVELWCLLMRELVAIGPQAVPWIWSELDQTQEDRARCGGWRSPCGPLAIHGRFRRRSGPFRGRSCPPAATTVSSSPAPRSRRSCRSRDLDKGPGQFTSFWETGAGSVRHAPRGGRSRTSTTSRSPASTASEDPRRRALQAAAVPAAGDAGRAGVGSELRRTFSEDEAYRSCRVELEDTVLLRCSIRMLWGRRPASSAKERLCRVAGDRDEELCVALLRSRHWLPPEMAGGVSRAEAALDSRQLADWAAEKRDRPDVRHASGGGWGGDVRAAGRLGMTVQEITSRDAREPGAVGRGGCRFRRTSVEEPMAIATTRTERLGSVPNADGAFPVYHAEERGADPNDGPRDQDRGSHGLVRSLRRGSAFTRGPVRSRGNHTANGTRPDDPVSPGPGAPRVGSRGACVVFWPFAAGGRLIERCLKEHLSKRGQRAVYPSSPTPRGLLGER